MKLRSRGVCGFGPGGHGDGASPAVLADEIDDRAPMGQPGVAERLTHNDLRALFDLPPLAEPRELSAPSGSPDNPLPGWYPYLIPGTNQWAAEFEGDTSTLPVKLLGLYILVTAKSQRGRYWVAPVREILDRTDCRIRVRTQRHD